MRRPQCRRQSKRNEGALAKRGVGDRGAEAQTWALGQLELWALPDFEMFTENKTKKGGQYLLRT